MDKPRPSNGPTYSLATESFVLSEIYLMNAHKVGTFVSSNTEAFQPNTSQRVTAKGGW